MKTIAWIFGQSASGKETFMKNVADQPQLLADLGWQNKEITIAEISVTAVSEAENNQTANERDKIPDEVSNLLGSSDVVLIKWQYIDSELGRIRQLVNALPGAEHIIINLQASPAVLAQRIKNKPWWTRYGEELDSVQAEMVKYAACLRDYEDLPIVTLSSNQKEYSILPTQPARSE